MSWFRIRRTLVWATGFVIFVACLCYMQRQTIKQLPSSSNNKNVKPFVFVKTHKTGSTSLRYIFGQYLFSRDPKVTVGRPLLNPFVGGYPGRIRFKYIHPQDKQIQAIFGHMRFDADELHRHMPKDTKYFTVLREPWAEFQSAYDFYPKQFFDKLKPSCFHMPSPHVLNGRTLDPVSFMHECARTLNKSIPWYFRFKNYQAHDLGFDPMLKDEEEIEKQIKALDESMNLVMINEYLQESLILLKVLHAFECELDMDWPEIVIKWIHKRPYEKIDLGLIDRQVFYKHNNLDIALYRHFNATFWRKIESYGRERMANDLIRLEEEITKDPPKKSNPERSDSKTTSSLQNAPQELIQYMEENSGSCFILSRD